MASDQEKKRYRKMLQGLKNYQNKLGLDLGNTTPTDIVVIVPGTDEQDRPVGALLPVYPKDECGTDEGTMQKTLFNLKSLLNFEPPQKKGKK